MQPSCAGIFVIGVSIRGVSRGIRHFAPAIFRHEEEGHIVNTAVQRRAERDSIMNVHLGSGVVRSFASSRRL
jgi:hypothetical protein